MTSYRVSNRWDLCDQWDLCKIVDHFSLLTSRSVRLGRFARRSEILDEQRYTYAGEAGQQQAHETVEVGQKRGLLIHDGVELAFSAVDGFNRRISGMHKDGAGLVQPIAINGLIGG